MRKVLLGVVLGSTLTAGLVGAGDYLGTGGGNYLHQNEVQSTLSDIRLREALETIQLQRQHYLDQQVRDAGKLPCQ